MYCMRFPVNFLDLVGLYGYSVSVWCVALILSVIPLTGVKWTVCIVALVDNILFVLRNYPSIFAGSGQEASLTFKTKQFSAGTIVMLLVVGSKLAMACMVLFWFLA